MPQKILRFFDRESKRVTEAAFILAGSGILADLLSLFRDRLLAARFGASRELDLYYAAFRVPDFIYTFSLFFAASTALLPILVEKFSEDETKAKVFFRDIFSLFGITALALVALAYFLMPAVSPYVAPGFLPEEGARMILLSRILLFSPLLLGLSSLVSSVVQSFRRFYVYALSPLLYNLGIIFGILFWEPVFGLPGIVWGVVLGAALHLWVQLPTVFSLGFTLWPRFPKISREVISSLKLSLPRTLGLSLNQLVLTVITALGSTLGAGAVAVFNFAQNLQSVPLSVIGLSYAVGVFPTLSISFVRNRRNEFLEHFSLAFRHIVFWSLPATVLFIVLRAQIVRVILGAGAFSWMDTRLVAAALLLLSLSILAQGLVMLLVRAFYAAGHTFLPVGINLISSVATIAGAFGALGWFQNSPAFRSWFLGVLKVPDFSGAGVLVLPLAVSLGSLINVFLLLIYFKRIFGSFDGGARLSDGQGLNRSLRDAALSSVILGAATYYALKLFALLFRLDTFVGIFSQGFLAGTLGILAGALVLYWVQNREFQEISSAFRRKLWREVPVVASEPEKLP